MQSIEFHYSVGPRLGGCAALLCRGSAGTTPARPPAANTTADRDADGRSPPVADAAASATGARAIPASNRQQLVSRDSAPCGARVCGGCALRCTHLARDKRENDIHQIFMSTSRVQATSDKARTPRLRLLTGHSCSQFSRTDRSHSRVPPTALPPARSARRRPRG